MKNYSMANASWMRKHGYSEEFMNDRWNELVSCCQFILVNDIAEQGGTWKNISPIAMEDMFERIQIEKDREIIESQTQEVETNQGERIYESVPEKLDYLMKAYIQISKSLEVAYAMVRGDRYNIAAEPIMNFDVKLEKEYFPKMLADGGVQDGYDVIYKGFHYKPIYRQDEKYWDEILTPCLTKAGYKLPGEEGCAEDLVNIKVILDVFDDYKKQGYCNYGFSAYVEVNKRGGGTPYEASAVNAVLMADANSDKDLFDALNEQYENLNVCLKTADKQDLIDELDKMYEGKVSSKNLESRPRLNISIDSDTYRRRIAKEACEIKNVEAEPEVQELELE